MKRLVEFIFRYLLFWLIVFFINRLIFLVSVVPFLHDATLFHSLRAFVSGWALDISAAGYLLPIPGFFFSLSMITRSRPLFKITNIFVYIFIVLYCLICFGELLLYREWTTKLTMQALLHLQHPAEVFKTAQVHTVFLFFGLTLFFSIIYVWLYKKIVTRKAIINIPTGTVRERIVTAAAALLLFPGINFLMIRGGWRAIPISDSEAYYSPSHILNDAAVNPLWSLGHNILEYRLHQETNPYLFMSVAQATTTLRQMTAPSCDSTTHFLNTGKPNIVIIILEGYTAYALPNFGGDDYAPFLDSLSRQGLSFTNCYAAAYASDQGIPAVLSGYPSTPRVAITNQSSKTKDIPCISRDLKPLGYQSGFIFGGQLNYGNIKSYLYNAKVDVVRERADFPESMREGHLGIHDADMVPLVLEEINKAKSPFVYAWFTVSSHSPYDIPEPIKEIDGVREYKYMNTVSYTDRAMRNFFNEAKQQPWFKNTLFLVISDHSHFCQRDFSIEDKEYHRIVAFFYGDVIKPEFRGKKIERIVSQVDFAPTIAKQFNLTTTQYIFGKNIMNPCAASFAYYDFHHGSGLITDSCFISRRDKSTDLLMNTCGDSTSTNALVFHHEAYLQKVFTDYLAR